MHTLAPPLSDAPTEVRTPRPRVSDRVRRNAALTAEQLSPGRYLAIEDGGEVVVISVGEGALRIGRGIGADVVLEDRSVSRRHAVITCRDGEVVLLDDRSLNGVWVNGERVGQATLRDGDAIAVGDVQMRFLAIG
ncbi:MAG: FHA domain-containing protein [Actinomycetota bacterium]|nr:FHA domain-containing protein [Actinomycetota bacterium]